MGKRKGTATDAQVTVEVCVICKNAHNGELNQWGEKVCSICWPANRFDRFRKVTISSLNPPKCVYCGKKWDGHEELACYDENRHTYYCGCLSELGKENQHENLA